MPQAVSAIGLTTGHAPFVEEARNRGELYIEQAYDLYSDEIGRASCRERV